SQPEPGCETAEDTLEDSDVVITGVQPGQPLPASLTSRVADFRAMVLQPDTWLDDCAIDHAQALLKAKYPHVGGLYATTCRKAAQIVGCLPSQTVSLSAEVRIHAMWNTINHTCGNTSFHVFRLET
ncbi:hypothetical protein JZ751_015325, partial [Albula glossodonta]